MELPGSGVTSSPELPQDLHELNSPWSIPSESLILPGHKVPSRGDGSASASYPACEQLASHEPLHSCPKTVQGVRARRGLMWSTAGKRSFPTVDIPKPTVSWRKAKAKAAWPEGRC